MQIVIVEDEIKIREGLKSIIEKFTPHKVVACECDGKAGLEEIRRLRPDVVFTDICMPVMDGLSMLEQIRDLGMNTYVVLLTGYSEFEYARRSIQLMAEDYLLKPLNVEDIIESLDKIGKKIDQTKSEQVSEEQLVFSILTESETDRNMFVKQLEQRLHVHFGEKISLFLLRNNSVVTETANEMISLLEEILPSMCLTNYHMFRLPDRHYVMVLILDGQSVHYIKELFLMSVWPSLNEIGECMIGYREIASLMELKETLVKMKEDFKYGFFLEKPRILDKEFIRECHFEELNYPDALEQVMRKELQKGNRKKAEDTAKRFSEQVIDSHGEPAYRKEYTVRFLLAAIQSVREYKEGSFLDSISHSLWERIMQCATKEGLQYEYQKSIETLLCDEAQTESADNGMILHVIAFIRLNYDRDISLSEAAEVVGITPEYLSKLFVKEMGINFSTFLRDFRIRMAKSILLDEKYKIYEVAESVGYRDTKYFNKVFKSVVGISPSDYRKAGR